MFCKKYVLEHFTKFTGKDLSPETQDVKWKYIRRSEDVQDVFWTSYVRSSYVVCLRECHSLFFSKLAGVRPANLLKKRLWHRCFLVKFVKVLRTTFFIEHLSWLLLLLVVQVAIKKRMCMNIVFLYFYGMRLIINQIRIKLLLSTIRSSHS